MRRIGILALAALALLSATPSSAAGPPTTTEQWLNLYQTSWNNLNTYQATITAREYLNGKIQDRVYVIKFQKPTNVRLDIVGGDGKGSAAVWTGGDRVNGHQGSILSIIHLNVNIHAKIATSMRGRTIADASFGAALEAIKAIKFASTQVTVDGDRSTLTGIPADPTQDGGIIKEVMTLGPNGLPVELTEFEGAAPGSVARHEVYTDVLTNVAFPDSTWRI